MGKKGSRKRATNDPPYVVLEENRLAYSTLRLLGHPTESRHSTLLLIHGPAGAGKTSLVSYYLKQWESAGGRFRLLHTNAAEFDRAFREAIHKRTTQSFAERYSTAEVLICDDLQDLARKKETQWQFLHCIDEVLACNGWVILTSRLSPGELVGFLPRLVSRFRGGHCMVLRRPSFVGRVQCLRVFASALQIAIPSDVADLMAAAHGNSPSELLQQLLEIERVARSLRAPIDRQLASRVLTPVLSELKPSLSRIARAVSRHFGISLKDLRSHSRVQRIVRPRQMAIFLGRTLAANSYREIASFFGLRNHSSAIHAYRQTRELIETDAALRSQLSAIEQLLAEK